MREELSLQDLSVELEKLRTSKQNSFRRWRSKASALKVRNRDRRLVNYCLSRAYTCRDGFYPYLKDILGYGELYKPFHEPITDLTVNPHYRYKMIQACRGSFKTAVSTLGYATWLIAREYALLGTCNIRILIGSEVKDLAESFVSAIGQTVQYNARWTTLYGKHKGEREDRKRWREEEFTSSFRTKVLPQATCSAISTKSPKAGNHYDVIIADDLETERASATRDQIEKCWTFYRLLHSLLEPEIPGHLKGVIERPEMLLVSTRWHYDDIYARILKEDADEPFEDEKFKVVIQPAVDPITKEPAFPTRFGHKTLDNLKRKHGSYLFACQYLLDPTPEEDRDFPKSCIHYVRPEHFTRPRVRTFVGGDFAYTEQSRLDSGEIRKADYTVFFTVLVDEFYNFIFKDYFRGRCSRRQGILEMFRQYYAHGAINCALQKFDQSMIDEDIKRIAREQHRRPKITYVSYPNKGGRGTQNVERIKGMTSSFEANKVFLLPGMGWFEDELLEFPAGVYDDGLNALANIMKVANPPPPTSRKSFMTPLEKHVKWLHSKRKHRRTVNAQGITEHDPDAWKFGG